jgi:hypothetical protein
VTIRGPPLPIAITFQVAPVAPTNAPGASQFLGLPAAEGYGFLAGLVLAAVLVAAVIGLSQRQRKRRDRGDEP